MFGVNGEVRCVDVVAFEHHFEDLWLMDLSFLHEHDDLVLLGDGLFNIVIKLDLNFVFNLSLFSEEIFILWWESEVFAIFSQ